MFSSRVSCAYTHDAPSFFKYGEGARLACITGLSLGITGVCGNVPVVTGTHGDIPKECETEEKFLCVHWEDFDGLRTSGEDAECGRDCWVHGEGP